MFHSCWMPCNWSNSHSADLANLHALRRPQACARLREPELGQTGCAETPLSCWQAAQQHSAPERAPCKAQHERADLHSGGGLTGRSHPGSCACACACSFGSWTHSPAHLLIFSSSSHVSQLLLPCCSPDSHFADLANLHAFSACADMLVRPRAGAGSAGCAVACEPCWHAATAVSCI